MKLKKGDTILVTGGKDKGRKGKIERIMVEEQAVVVPGVNLYKRHRKKRDDQHPGGIIDFPRPLPVSSVMLVCPKCNQPTRIGYITIGGGKERICRKCEQKI